MIKKYILSLCFILVAGYIFLGIRGDDKVNAWRGYTGDSVEVVCGKDNKLAVFRRNDRYYWIDKSTRNGEQSFPVSTFDLYTVDWYFDGFLNSMFDNRVYLLGNLGFLVIEKDSGDIVFYGLKTEPSERFRSKLEKSYYNFDLTIYTMDELGNNYRYMSVYKYLSGQLSDKEKLTNFSLLLDNVYTIL